MSGICISGGKRDKRNNHIINEDYIINKEKYKIIIDGSTGLGDNYIDSYLTSAEWYVLELSKFLEKKLDNCKSTNDIRYVVKDAIIYMNDLINIKVNRSILNKYEEPSCSLMIVYEFEDKIVIFSIGDIIAFIKKKNTNDIKIIRDNIINKIDESVFNLMKDISIELGISIKESRNDERVNKLLRENRNKMNEENGYYIVSTDESVVNRANIVEYYIEEIEKIFICSDGFYFDALNISYDEFLNKVNNDNLNSYYEIIKNNLLLDINWNKYSKRFKSLDDVSALVAYEDKKI